MNEVARKLCLLFATEKPYKIIFTAIEAINKEDCKYEENVTNFGTALFKLVNQIYDIKEEK